MASHEDICEAWKVRSKSAEETFRLGKKMGELLPRGSVIALCGELGSGKTLLAKGIARGMQVANEGEVTSPSFTLVNEYQGRCKIYHVDLYRLQNVQQIEDLGWEEMIFGSGVTLIEWPEKVLHLLPEDRIEIFLEWVGEEERDLEFQSKGKIGKELILRLREKWMKGE
jgi:tRNA threonylcarbamoyladenosine biosynthesis protein TsaE